MDLGKGRARASSNTRFRAASGAAWICSTQSSWTISVRSTPPHTSVGFQASLKLCAHQEERKIIGHHPEPAYPLTYTFQKGVSIPRGSLAVLWGLDCPRLRGTRVKTENFILPALNCVRQNQPALSKVTIKPLPVSPCNSLCSQGSTD